MLKFTTECHGDSLRIEKAITFKALTKDYKSDRIDRIFRIFFAFHEERQKVLTLFEGTTWTKSCKNLA
jgi:hypothetical protein